MPKVLLDLRMVNETPHGIARYALELARRLPRLAPQWEFIGLAGPQGLPSNLEQLHPEIPIVRCFAGFLSPFEQPSLAASLARIRPDLFHATSFSIPRFWNGRLIGTLHDANHLALKDEYGFGQAFYYRHIVGPRIRRANAVITVSNFSKLELIKHLGILEERIHVIYQGISDCFYPASTTDKESFIRRKNLPEAFVAVVGNSKNFKNIEVLGKMSRALPLPVVVVAGKEAAHRIGNRHTVYELSGLSDADMNAFYSSASVLVFPSRYEGFGLPALEAMACGTPVVASNKTSLPEVISEGGLLVGPDDPEAFQSAIEGICTRAELRSQLIIRGKKRAAFFSWDKCADETLRLYKKVLNGD